MRTVKRSLAGLLFLVPAVSFASGVAADDAARAALAWIDRGYALGRFPADCAVAGVDEAEDPSSGARLWVVRFEGGGYVVLSADDRIDPVLAFSETGSGLEQDDRNPLWTLLRGDVAAREAAAGVSRTAPAGARGAEAARLRRGAAAPTESQRKWAELLSEDAGRRPLRRDGASSAVTASEVRVEPFVLSKWNQFTVDNVPVESNGLACYNYYTPGNYLCGCVATAGAQLMRYWRWPQAAVPASVRACAIDHSPFQATMGGYAYDWASMPLDPLHEPNLTEAQRAAIGRLTYDVSASIGTDWRNWTGGTNSTANLFGLSLRLSDTFGYASVVSAGFDDDYPWSSETLQRIVIPNCDARTPVAMGIRIDKDHGHVAVVDGCGWSGGTFCVHLNVGASGAGDAWYIPPDISFENLAFHTVDQFVFNVFPTNTGSIFSGRVLDSNGAAVDGAAVTLSGGAGSAVKTATTDAKGVYAFIAPAGSYRVLAVKEGYAADARVRVGETVGVRIVDEYGWQVESKVSTIGNSWTNDLVLAGMVSAATPVLSPEGCFFHPTTNVVVSCDDGDATIRYTLDGTDPTESSPICTGTVRVEDTATLKVRAFAVGKNASPVASASFVYDGYDEMGNPDPKGDRFDNPIPIAGAAGSRHIDDNSVYTLEPGEPDHTGGYAEEDWGPFRTIWYRWTAPGSGTMVFQSTSKDYFVEDDMTNYVANYTALAVYVGDSLSSAVQIAFEESDEDDYDYTTTLSIDVVQGTTYRIVGMNLYYEDDTGDFSLSWSGNLSVAVKTPYETWAEAYGRGGPALVEGGGVENAFRYVFGEPDPAECFSPISGIESGTAGLPVLSFPPVVNTAGVSLKVLSTTNLADWSSAAVSERDFFVDVYGRMTMSDTDPCRFYRLKATVEMSSVEE